MPSAEAIGRPEGVSAEDMAELLTVDREGWRAEIADVHANHYPKFGSRMPAELWQELRELEARLAS